MLRILIILFLCYFGLVMLVYFRQRSLLYFPTHRSGSGPHFQPWSDGANVIGFCREVDQPEAIWLMTHGNGGQAADRDYMLPCLSTRDSLYVLEYPGYGLREGSPSLRSINHAASAAYQRLRSANPRTPVCVIGESLGSGPACTLAREKIPPDKIVLAVPYDSLAGVAAERFRWLPVRFLLEDKWDNGEALKNYHGPVEIFAAVHDEIIPFAHAQALAKRFPRARFISLPCGHNDWAGQPAIRLTSSRN